MLQTCGTSILAKRLPNSGGFQTAQSFDKMDDRRDVEVRCIDVTGEPAVE